MALKSFKNLRSKENEERTKINHATGKNFLKSKQNP